MLNALRASLATHEAVMVSVMAMQLAVLSHGRKLGAAHVPVNGVPQRISFPTSALLPILKGPAARVLQLALHCDVCSGAVPLRP
jgi:hypothetical protein